MSILSRLTHLWSHLAHRDAADTELTAELRAYVDLLVEEKVRTGVSPRDAHRAALIEVGGVSQVQDIAQHARSGATFERLRQDLRYALRTLRRAPAFAIAAIVVLALGIGASTTVLSVVEGVLLKPFSYATPEQLVVILNNGNNPLATANFLDLKKQNHSFSAVGAAEYWTPSLVGTDRAEKVNALRITSDILPMLGVPAALGRVWNAENDAAGNAHVAVISHRLWQRRYNGDSTIIGRRVLLDGESYSVVGVMPASFQFAPFWATKAELWAPLPLAARADHRDDNSLRVFARLAPGVALDRARNDVAGIVAGIERQFPGSNSDVQVTPLIDKVVGNFRTPLLLMLGAVGFVLLMSCANVAHMMLARAAARQREMAVRAALGAGRTRLVRQVLTESILLAGLGGAFGLALALAGVRVVAAFGAESIPRLQTVSINAVALSGAILLTLACGIGFGLAPALRSARNDMASSLRAGGRGSTGGGWEGARRALIASQFALAVVLLVGAGLMIRSVVALQSIDPGLKPRGIVSAVVSVAGTAQSPAGKRAAFYQSVVRQLSMLPTVANASAINHVPLGGDVWGFSFRIEGRPAPSTRADTPNAAYRVVLPNYFATMGIKLSQGRDFTDGDRATTPGVVIVNEFLAAKQWPGENPIGHRVSFADADKPPEWLTVVGVSANTVRDQWTAPPQPEVFLPLLQEKNFLENPESHFAQFTLVVREKCNEHVVCDANSIVPAIRRVVAGADATVPVSDVLSMDDAIAAATAEPRFYLTLLAGFAAVALLLAAVGIYGVMSYAVAQRTREMGVRLALGAAPRAVLAQLLREGVLLAMSGAAVGVVISLLLSRFMTTVLFGVRANDPATFVAVVSVLMLAAAVAVFIPARRATSIDPLLALRAD